MGTNAVAALQAPAVPEVGPVRESRPHLGHGGLRELAGRSDEFLAQIACEGDRRAFEVLYERHSAGILRYCRSLLRSPQEAEDVKQEVFVLAISALRRGTPPLAFRPWLYRVAHNACVSHLRVRRPLPVAEEQALEAQRRAVVEPAGERREELRELLADIRGLPEIQRGALLLREVDGFSYEEVGAALGLSQAAVRSTIFRARRTLQGLQSARETDCVAIRSELSRLAARRGRRSRSISSHLGVCAPCRRFRDDLRRARAAALVPHPGAFLGLLAGLKAKLLGGGAAAGAGASGAAATATTTAGGSALAKLAAVAASGCIIAAGTGLEAGDGPGRPGPGAASAATVPSPHRADGTRQTVSLARARGTSLVAASTPAHATARDRGLRAPVEPGPSRPDVQAPADSAPGDGVLEAPAPAADAAPGAPQGEAPPLSTGELRPASEAQPSPVVVPGSTARRAGAPAVRDVAGSARDDRDEADDEQSAEVPVPRRLAGADPEEGDADAGHGDAEPSDQDAGDRLRDAPVGTDVAPADLEEVGDGTASETGPATPADGREAQGAPAAADHLDVAATAVDGTPLDGVQADGPVREPA